MMKRPFSVVATLVASSSFLPNLGHASPAYTYHDLGSGLYPLAISSNSGYVAGGLNAVQGSGGFYLQANLSTGGLIIGSTTVPTVTLADGVNDNGIVIGTDQMHIIGYQYSISMRTLSPVPTAGEPAGHQAYPAAISNTNSTPITATNLICGWTDAPDPGNYNCFLNGADYEFSGSMIGTMVGFGSVNDSGVCSAFFGNYTYSGGTWTNVGGTQPNPSSYGVGTLFLAPQVLGCSYSGINASNVDMGSVADSTNTPIAFRGSVSSKLTNPYNVGTTNYGSVGYGINNSGYIVGALGTPTSGIRAFVAPSTTEVDLNSVTGSIPSGYTLEYATAIDNVAGDIVGISWVMSGRTKVYHGFLLIPTGAMP